MSWNEFERAGLTDNERMRLSGGLGVIASRAVDKLAAGRNLAEVRE